MSITDASIPRYHLLRGPITLCILTIDDPMNDTIFYLIRYSLHRRILALRECILTLLDKQRANFTKLKGIWSQNSSDQLYHTWTIILPPNKCRVVTTAPWGAAILLSSNSDGKGAKGCYLLQNP